VGLRVAGLAAVAVLGLSACGGGGGDGPRTGGGAGSSTSAAKPLGKATPHRRHRSDPSARTLARQLNGLAHSAGHATGAYVYDVTSGRQLYALRDTVRRPPASVEKLFTTVALLTDLGAKARLHTSVYGTGQLGAGGVWHGNLYLRGDGDPTLGDGAFNRIWLGGYGPTAVQLAHEIAHDGIRSVTGMVIGDASLFDGHRGPPSSAFQPDIPDLGGQLSALTYDHGSVIAPPSPHTTSHGASSSSAHTPKPTVALTPASFTAKEFTLTLNALHVHATASVRTLPTPHGARRLAGVASPPMSVMLRLMDVPSDDFFAEMLAKQLGAKVVGQGSTAAGALAIRSAVERYGIHPKVTDGSGLSRDDQTSPLEVVDLLRAIHHTPTGSVLYDALPTVGVNGTVRTIATGTAAAGSCVAKTGTLNNVSNLAGYCHARGHQLVAFALFVDGPPNWVALPLIGKMVATIAEY
jgi:D-alanyl-D-alanine carboxypeptidase/D-alanyl-D-alanine-endopeptidase (penicillin-binding protein 4)